MPSANYTFYQLQKYIYIHTHFIVFLGDILRVMIIVWILKNNSKKLFLQNELNLSISNQISNLTIEISRFIYFNNKIVEGAC